MFTKQQPHIEKTEGPMEGERYTHPAYGQISVVKGRVGNQGGYELFGSELKHRNVLTITISTAYLDRSLHRDWIHSDRDVVSFHMSESQWSSFVSSQGGAALPITFERRPIDDARIQLVPGIESPETTREQFDREIRERCQEYMATSKQLVEQLQAALNDGKTSKATLKSLLDLATNLNTGMPNTMGYVQKQMFETMEQTVSAGKMEIEAFVNDLAVRTGLETLRNQSVQLIDSELDHDDQSNAPTVIHSVVPPELDSWLGKIPDSEIASRFGVSLACVQVRRKKLGIPAPQESV
ncbi:hypothetical protein [Pseudomonas sp. MWU12-2323]|uniref:hypothetical protein n=1 Tax=Pseudomonas sp. MWU12-2323 TaxID=2651296 RepID=UPI0015B49BA3|nr:hypothetical protein [Pseudomonas sp. MWU12-2323]